METDKVIIYADGGSRGNGKEDSVSGWGVVLQYNDRVKELYGSSLGKTNNFMEITAIIRALQNVKTDKIPIIVYSDSQYCVRGMNEWVQGWRARNWVKSDKKPVLNKELWIQLLELSEKQRDIKYVWVKGHENSKGNLRADALANISMDELEKSMR